MGLELSKLLVGRLDKKTLWLGLSNIGGSFLEDTNKQTVGTHHNKRFHKSTVSAEVEL